jgi:hypothetical protein
MWNKVDKQTELIMLKKAIIFTGNYVDYEKSMNDVVFKWKNTMLNNLSNLSINRKAFLGHCAVFYKMQIPEYIVREAWKMLTDEQRIKANISAENTIKKWELWYMNESKSILKHGKKDAIKTGYQTKLPFK